MFIALSKMMLYKSHGIIFRNMGEIFKKIVIAMIINPFNKYLSDYYLLYDKDIK